MGRYSSSLNDDTIADGDVGFLGVNNRLPNWELPAGMLSLSENGRIDGDWIPRKGADVVAEGSLSTGQPLRLPFWLVDEPGGEIVTVGERVGSTVTLTVPGHGLPVGGDSAASVIVNPTGSDNSILYTAVLSGDGGTSISIQYADAVPTFDIAVAVVVDAITVYPAQYGSIAVTGPMTSNGVTPVVFPTLRYTGLFGGLPRYADGDGTPSYEIFWDSGSISWVLQKNGDAVWLGFPTAGDGSYENPIFIEAWVPQGSATGDPLLTPGLSVGSKVSDAVNADSVASLLVTSTPSGASASPVAPIGPIFLQGGSGGGAYLGLEDVAGSPTVDPNGIWMMMPTDANTLTFDIPGAIGSESYMVVDAVVLSRLDDEASDEVLGSCLFSDPSSNNDESIFLAFGTDVKRVALSDGSIISYGLPGSETIDEPCDMIQAMDTVFIFRSGKVGLQWQVGDTDFSEVPSGAYTQPQVFQVSGTLVDVVSGLCTITGLTNSTVDAGDEILIYDSTDPHFIEFKGNKYPAVTADATSLSFYIPVENLSTIGTNTLSLGRQVSIGGGFIHQPAFPWAVYFQRRLWGPYWFDYGTPFVDRDIRDELVASDILDANTYDPILNQFRITDGTADYIVAMHPFYNDALLILNRNSLHGVFGTVGSLADTSVRELTREIGCLARKSVVSQGGSVFFLSDSGVYVLEFFNDYNLRGVEKPLSENIQPYMDRISKTLAPESVGIYFNNRYYLAVPLDSSPGSGDAIGNNALLIYNLTNREWESVDTFGDPAFLIKNLILGRAEKRNDIYAVTSAGGIHILEARDNDYDILATNFVAGSGQFDIPAVMRTRAFICGTAERKRFIEMGCQMRSGSAQSDVGLAFSAEDPDNAGIETLVSNSMNGPLSPNNTADIRLRIGGVRGFNGSVTLRRDIGRPSIRSVKVRATVTNRETMTQK